jgi:hypothetical protein
MMINEYLLDTPNKKIDSTKSDESDESDKSD